MRRIFFLALFAPLFVFAYVSPGNPTGALNDFAGLFSASERQTLELELRAIQTANGVDFVVVTVPSLGGDVIENYAVKLFEEWGIGQAETDNGLLLLISRDDRELRFEVGYGVEPIFTDTESSIVIRDAITPQFREGKYFDGLRAGIQKTAEALGTELQSTQETTPEDSFGGFLYNFIFVIPVLASLLGRTKSWWLGGVVGGVLSLLVSFLFGFTLFQWIISFVAFVGLGLLFDYIFSKGSGGHGGGMFLGGFGGGGMHGGGFGGFGGGGSGGGGSSGRW